MAAPKVKSQVEVQVKVGGKALGGDFTFSTVTISNSINRIPTAIVEIPDGKQEKQDFPNSASKDPELIPGKDVEISFSGLGGKEPKTLFKGVLVKHGLKVRNNKSSLVLHAKDKAVKMTVGKKNAYFNKKSDKEIIEALIGAASGTTASMGSKLPKNKHTDFFQYNCTDWDFMLMRAEAIGTLVICKDNTIEVKKPKLESSAKFELTYGVNIVELELEVSGHSQLKSVKASSWDIKEGKVISSSKTDPSPKFPDVPAGKMKAADLAGKFAPPNAFLVHRGALKKELLDQWAEGHLLRSRMARVQGRIKTHGVEVSPGDTIEVKGVGAALSGKIYVSGVRHILIGSVWHTHIQVGLPPHWHYQFHKHGQETSMNFYNSVPGLQPALVTKLEEDPDTLHRIQINLNFWGEEPPCLVWARMAFPNAGSERGFQWLPTVGDEVLVGFMHGDAAFPVILGSMFNSNSAPPVAYSKDNMDSGIYTTAGSKMVFHEEDDKNSMTIESGSGHKVLLDDASDSEKILIQDKNENKIEMTKDGIKITSCKDLDLITTDGKLTLTAGGEMKLDADSNDLKMAGGNIKLEAGQKFSADGSSGADLTSSATVKVKGSQVNIN